MRCGAPYVTHMYVRVCTPYCMYGGTYVLYMCVWRLIDIIIYVHTYVRKYAYACIQFVKVYLHRSLVFDVGVFH